MKSLNNSIVKAVRISLIFLLTLPVIPSAVQAQSSSPSASAPLPPMAADADPSFEVATIKLSDTSSPHGTYLRSSGHHVIAYNISVADLISYAYGLHARQIIGEPSSLLATHFDIDGVPDLDGHANLRQSRLMFQKLLISRFKLTFRYESRELSAYAIQIVKGGPKLTPTTRKPGDNTNFSYTCQAVLTVRNASIADIAKGMQEAFLDRPVVDQTGLQDQYDFDLKWTPDESQTYCPNDAARRDDPSAPPGFYTAIQEQLGLRIASTRAPIQVMVVDHLDKPSEN